MRRLSVQETWERAESLDAVESPELLTLKAHALLDGVLSRIVASHLGTHVDRLPSLSFAHVAQLAVAAEDVIAPLKPVIDRVDEARNHVAHEWHPTALPTHMERLAGSMAVGPWPTDTRAQVAVFRIALKKLIATVNGASHFAAMTPEDWQGFEADLKQHAEDAIGSLRR